MKHHIKTVFLLLAFLLPNIVSAHDFEVDGIYYDINGTSVTYMGSQFERYLAYIGSMTIPATVTYNGKTYPVTAIGNSAFKDGSSLTDINIPNSITSIGNRAFYGCSSLTNIDIPNSVTSIGDWAFYYCSSLTNIIIPNSVTYIGSGAFSDCSSITTISVASNNPNYDSRNNCNAIIETATNTLIAGCMNTTIPNSVTSIGSGAFSGRSSLTNINIPNSVTTIGVLAFDDCSSVTAINIPNSVTTISNDAFSGCSSLVSISVASDNPKYDSRNNCNAIIETATNTLIAGCMNTTIPNSVTSIGDEAFYNCSSLTAVNIPNSVTSIGDEAFSGCSSLTAVNIPNSVTSISDWAFKDCSSLTTVNIPNSVTTIGDWAFKDCSSLTTVNIPSSVITIGHEAFSGCSSLNDVYCYATTPPECNDSFDYSATLHVPAASLAAYLDEPEWCEFENIVGDAVAPTGIAISRDSVETQSGE